MKQYNAGDFFKKHYEATLKKTRFYKGHELLDFNQPNILYYTPRLFMQTNAYLNDPDYDPNPDPNKYVNLAFKELQNENKISHKSLVNLGYQFEPYPFPASALSMDLEARLFDDQANLIIQTETKGYKFNHGVLNVAYATAYIANGSTHWAGVTVAFPELDPTHVYYLDLIEKYRLDAQKAIELIAPSQKMHVKGRIGNFTRKVTVPITPVDTIGNVTDYHPHWMAYNPKQIIFDKAFVGMQFEFAKKHPDIIEPQQKIKRNQTDLSAIGRQSILLDFNNVPQLILDPSAGVFNEYYGESRDVMFDLEDALNRTNREMPKETLTLIDKIVKTGDDIPNKTHFAVNNTSSYMAALLGLHYQHDNNFPELDHNGQGSELINFAYLMNQEVALENHIPQYLDIMGTKRHYSRYDFEEKLPVFLVNASKS